MSEWERILLGIALLAIWWRLSAVQSTVTALKKQSSAAGALIVIVATRG